MEYCEGGSLEDFIEENGLLFEHQAQFWFKQLVNGLEALHSTSIIHRDFKPDNILLTSKDFSATLKIADFGMSKQTELIENKAQTLVKHSKGVGTPVWSAPEVLNGLQTYNQQVDMWGLGTVLYKMIFGKGIFEDSESWENLIEL